jgi:hypothetical protein
MPHGITLTMRVPECGYSRNLSYALVEQKLPTLPWHLSSLSVFSVVRGT